MHRFTMSSSLCFILIIGQISSTLEYESPAGTSEAAALWVTPLGHSLVHQIIITSQTIAQEEEFARWFEGDNSTQTSYFYSTIDQWMCYKEVCLVINSNILSEILVSKDKIYVVLRCGFTNFIKYGRFMLPFVILVLSKPILFSMYYTTCSDLRNGIKQFILHIISMVRNVMKLNHHRRAPLSDVPCFPLLRTFQPFLLLLVALRKTDMRVEFEQVFRRLREKKGFSFDRWGYNVCIHAFGCWGDLATCFNLFKEMKGLVSPDLCTYNSLIAALCRLGKVDDALLVWEELNSSPHQPDRFTYTNLIHACSKTYRLGDATRLFNHMQSNGLQPDTLVYNSLVNGHFKATKVTEACQLFEKMVQEGVKPSSWTYNILIHGLLRNGRAEAAYTMFCDLKKKGQFVDGITYSIVVLQLCKEGQLEEALQLVEEMEARGFVVDLVTITSLLISIHRHGRWDWTDRLMKHIREGNLLLSVLKWTTGMEASMKNPPCKKMDYTSMFPSKGDFSDIMSFMSDAQDTNNIHDGEETTSNDIDEWSSSPHMDKLADQVSSIGRSSQLFTPSCGQRVQEKGSDSFDVDMVNTFLSIFLSKGKLSLACKLFEIFTDAGVDPASYTYNSIMSSFVKKGYFTEAWAILNEMGEKLCPADIATYNMIIQGLGKMGKADLASAVLDRLLKQGGYLDIVMYNTLINALGKAGRIDEVNKLFEQMRSSGLNPDVVTYNTLIEVHSKAGLLKDAYKFLKMMLDAGCSPNHVTDTTLDYLGREIDKLRYQRASILSEKDDPS
ncbi:hypothetical protein Fmac_013167 [Flemingia macrophylla]|uniref:Pentatricopeptide repeat-containing protein n=1 Tax=Flemingia macrophylla TaxID=520843 RepID=A0ABD1MSD5_9FABA